MGNLRKTLLTLFTVFMTACATAGPNGVPIDCPRLHVRNVGYETIRVSYGNRRIGTVDGFGDNVLSLCGFHRLDYVDIAAIGGRYNFRVQRPGNYELFSGDTFVVIVGEFDHTSQWLRD